VEINNFDNTQPYDNTDKKDFEGTPGSANDPSEKEIFANLVRIYQQIFNSSISSTVDLDSIIQELNNFKTTTDIDYNHNNAANITADNAKKTIYRQEFLEVEENHGGNESRVWESNIDEMIKLAQELKVWRQIGFNSIEDVLRANANGYWIAKRKGGTNLDEDNSINDGTNWGNLDEGTNEGKSNIQAIVTAATDNQSTGIGGAKYKGFPIIDRAKQSRVKKNKISAEGNEKFLIIDKGREDIIEFKMDNSCGREEIDNFRKLEVKDTGGDEVPELSVFKDINRVERKDLFGFQPGDINGAGEYEGIDLKDANVWKVAKGGESTKDHQMTKTKFDILRATSIEDALLCFLGSPDKKLKPSHYLDDFALSHTEVLDELYDFIKNDAKVQIAGKSYNDNNDDNKKFKKVFDNLYRELKKW
jgi:hypothetical protein